jgi:hypothetical protein
VRIATLGVISILPPLCIRNVRSETLATLTPSSALTAATTRSACAASMQATVTSRVTPPASTRTRSIAPRIAPSCPIAAATWAKAPGSWRSSMRIVNE